MSDPESGSIDLSIDGPVALITLNRPNVRNAIDLASARRLTEIVDQIEQDASIRVGIVTGAGKVAFSAGADLRARSRGEARAVFPPYGFAGFVRRPRTKPFVAAVNGYAVGGGLEIAMACEMVVAAPNATFSLPEPLRGLIAGGDCLPLALSRLPLSMAWDVALTGRRITAQEALQYGMVNAVADDVVAEARLVAQRIMTGAPAALAGTIAMMRRLLPRADAGYDEFVEATQQRLFKTHDAKEGTTAFLEKRDPVWTGT